MKPTEFQVLLTGLADTSQAPRGADVFYRCRECGGLVPSIPKDNVGCACGNIFVDIDYFRLAVRDLEKFQAVRRVSVPKRRVAG